MSTPHLFLFTMMKIPQIDMLSVETLFYRYRYGNFFIAPFGCD
jgi:hypothetical protein